MANIREIDKSTVHQICSGQVIVSLATAVKELLENSLDAGATSIDIKLKEYGLSSIEVIDNGCGVKESDFEGLALKHHTSKLQNFSDLTSVQTYGFRGEALSSLCALCKMVVTTRHKEAKVGARIDYDSFGKILKKSYLARPTGTSVSLSDIFYSLPVRRKEFKKNIKKEFHRLLTLLNGYCVVSTGVRIICTNETAKGNKSTLLSTTGASTVSENISDVFGKKQCSSLLEFDQRAPSLEACEAYSLKHDDAVGTCSHFVISGFVSTCSHGLGRSSTDRQFYSINKRPCDLPRVGKVVNEVFHTFNRYQYPFVQLDISMNQQDVDVNVTPDKRQIFVQQEKLIFAVVKTSLLTMFGSGMHAVGGMKQSVLRLTSTDKSGERSASTGGGDSNRPKEELIGGNWSKPVQPKCDVIKVLHQATTRNKPVERLIERTSMCSQKKRKLEVISSVPESGGTNTMRVDTAGEQGLVERNDDEALDKFPPEAQKSGKKINFSDTAGEPKLMERNDADVLDKFPAETQRTGKKIKFSIAMLRRNLVWLKETIVKGSNVASLGHTFKARIAPDQGKEAEIELTKYFNKASFRNIEIIGQFNLGFVVARHQSDIFIIDQHASDEKYNFEELQRTTTLHGQMLIVPQKLELTASDRLVVRESADIFKKNGFGFKFMKNEDSGQETVYLTKVPTSKNWVFEAKDVMELIFMLTDMPNTLCRPSNVRKMFASRACRMSVMVGTPLTHSEMKDIALHMAEMNQPWNCPHGRPTIRHLVDLHMVGHS